jgi:predicted DNA-binding transcriptional regulator AlpA
VLKPTDLDLIRVLTRSETIKAVGVSEKTWERLEALGDVPTKTRLSQGRVGYRLVHIKEWLDARRETSTVRELIDSNWKQVGAASSKIVERLR